MSATPVELRVAGQTYRVVASAEEADLQRLAAMVDERAVNLTSQGRQVSAQSVLLAAITLAHELEEERAARRRVEQRSREKLTQVLARIDAALEETEKAVQPDSSVPDLDGARP